MSRPLASGKALQAKHGVPAAALARAADAGDSSATHALRDAGAALGQAIAFAVNLLDPEVVVLGGGLALGSDVYRSTAKTQCVPVWAEKAKEIQVLKGTLGLDAGMIGAGLTAATHAVAR